MADLDKLSKSIELLEQSIKSIDERLSVLEKAEIPQSSKKQVVLGKSGYKKGSTLDLQWEKDNKKKK